MRIGLIETPPDGAYTQGDLFRAKMIASLLGAGFTPVQVEAAVAAGWLNLRHVDRYVFRPAGPPSARTFAGFCDALGADRATLVPAVYRLLGLPPPAPEARRSMRSNSSSDSSMCGGPLRTSRPRCELRGSWGMGRGRPRRGSPTC